MRLKFTLVFILIIVGLAVYGYFQSVPGAGNQAENLPKIEIFPEYFDFGQIDYGQVVEYDFSLKNTGSATLEIKRVATSCACTSAQAAKKEIMPGEEVPLRVTYDTGAMSGPHGQGSQERIIYVKSSDPVNPQVEVKIRAYVRPR